MARLYLDEGDYSGGFVSHEYIIVREVFRKKSIGDTAFRQLGTYVQFTRVATELFDPLRGSH
jgi:hypothetical protein